MSDAPSESRGEPAATSDALWSRKIWCVFEHKLSEPQQQSYFYGAFTTEESARADYGEPSEGWRVEFLMCPLSGPEPS